MSLVLIMAGALAAGPTAIAADSDTATTSLTQPDNARTVSLFTSWSGSKSNATALVTGLESGSSITLTSSTGTTTSFTPASKLSPGDTTIALALARESLRQQGIRNPSPAQIDAALVGGSVVNKAGQPVSLKGVLTQRSSGMGWGEIAHSMGVKLGRLMSALHTHSHASHAGHHDQHGHHGHAGKSGHHSHTGKDGDHGASHSSGAKGVGQGHGEGGGHGGGR
ncbi:hypothetical protein [Andreprevotia chitinilytica]|uniref:hypothetical protein n=1 Tax=Andreprevotia chitinilytica TaxID=396808 RepID=UPI00068D6264|nr:hypothetical protein [Andreprevotia chitinilytica]